MGKTLSTRDFEIQRVYVKIEFVWPIFSAESYNESEMFRLERINKKTT